MPYGKKSYRKTFRKKAYRKRVYRPKKRYNRKRTYAKIRGTVLPDYTLVKLNNASVITIPLPSTVGVNEYSKSVAAIVGNDIYDPMRVFGDEQPVGFAQWMAMYQQFIVHKSTIKVTPICWIVPDSSSGTQLPFILSVFPSKNLLQNPLNALEPEEQPYVRKKNYNGNMTTDTKQAVSLPLLSAPGQSVQPGVYNSMMTKKILGYKDLSDVDEVRGTVNSSPTDLFYWNICVESQVPASTASNSYTLASMYVRVESVFYCQFIGRQSLEN